MPSAKPTVKYPDEAQKKVLKKFQSGYLKWTRELTTTRELVSVIRMRRKSIISYGKDVVDGRSEGDLQLARTLNTYWLVHIEPEFKKMQTLFNLLTEGFIKQQHFFQHKKEKDFAIRFHIVADAAALDNLMVLRSINRSFTRELGKIRHYLLTAEEMVQARFN